MVITQFNPYCVRTESLMSLETLRETEKTEAQIKISALELKVRVWLRRTTC